MDHEGSLEVYDIQGLPSHQMSCGQISSGVWNVKYCMLIQQKLWIWDLKAADNLFTEQPNDPKSDTEMESDVFHCTSYDESSSGNCQKCICRLFDNDCLNARARFHCTPIKRVRCPTMKKHSAKKTKDLEAIDVAQSPANSTPNKSLPRTPRSAGRKKGGKKFAFVSTRIGIRRSSSRLRRRSSSRRRDSLSRRSSGLYNVQVNVNEATSNSRRPRQPSDRDVFSPSKDGLQKNFLQRKIQPTVRRSKSTKMTSGKENYPVLDMVSLMQQGGSSRNPDVELPFFMPSIESPDAIDLSIDPSEFENAAVRSLHHSILGRDYCFEVISGKGTRCFGCSSAGEREAWIEKMRRAINPNLDNCRRTEHQLTLSVQEAKGLAAKKKYFCEICLDRKLCARTTSKWKNDSTVFWGEQFEFSSMPEVDDITVHLYKDSDKKKKKDKDYMGLVNLSVRSLVNQQSLEKWYTLSTPSGNNKNKAGEAMAVRIKARFLSNRVLPTEQYKDFAEHISRNYLDICKTLGNVLSVSRKNEIAKVLVNIMYATGCVKDYMCDLVMFEVEKVEEESLIFRENTIGTKSVEAFLRLVGMKYLHEALGEFIRAIFTMEEECEVDGSRLPPHANLDVNQKNLQMSCEIALCKITTSINNFPSELREVLSTWRVQCEAAGRPRIASRLVTASLFLRLLCPAILNPSLFGLANEVPDVKTSRTLTLIAKVIQNLANRSRFGTKEEYMQFMDAFVRQKWDDMGEFIGNVSDPTLPPLNKGFEGFIDLGKEFAKLHAFFVETLPTLDAATVEKLGELPDILQKITSSLENPSAVPIIRRIATEPVRGLSQIAEDTQLNTSSDAVSNHPGCSSSPVIDRHNLPPSATASSMVDLRNLVGGPDDVRYDEKPSSVSNGYSPVHHHASHSSIPVSSSFNNSNNVAHQRHRQTLSSTENIPTSRPPLQFANPAYQMQLQQKYLNRGTSSPAALHATSELSIFKPQSSLGKGDGPDVTERGAKMAYSPGSGENNLSKSYGVLPLAFTNPLQGLTMGANHRLETVFTTETVTYAAPSRFPRPATGKSDQLKGPGQRNRPAASDSGSSKGSYSSNDDSHSNYSTLSSRQSSTTTAADGTANSSMDESSAPRYAQPSSVLAKTKDSDPRGSPAGATPMRSAPDLPDNEMEDESLMVSVETVPASLSSASLKTGLQSQKYQQSRVAKAQPQPKPRSSFLLNTDDVQPRRKASVPAVSSPTQLRSSPSASQHRRQSADNIRRQGSGDDFYSKYPSLQLGTAEEDPILELSEETAEQLNPRSRDHATPSNDGFVNAPVVKSRVVNPTSNAIRVKTSKQVPTSGHQKSPSHGGRISSQKKSTPSSSKYPTPTSDTPSSKATFPPAASEEPISPEARTAQWILNSVVTNKDKKRSKDTEPRAVLTPKDYEDTIVRLENEVEHLRSQLRDKSDAQRTFEQKEAALLEKVRKHQFNEDKLRRQCEEKDGKHSEVLQRLVNTEAQQKSDQARYQALLEGKEGIVSDQRKRIGKLERENSRLSETVDKLNMSVAVGDRATSSGKKSRPSPETKSRPGPSAGIGYIDADETGSPSRHNRPPKQYATPSHNVWGRKSFDRDISAASLSSASSSV